MSLDEINVNNTDINTSAAQSTDLPLDLMGLFFFAYRDFVGDADAVLTGHGFGRAHHRVLYFVNLKPEMPVADLLDILGITKQSLARVLRQLIDNGYIEQKTGTSDRRQRLLIPTTKGQEYFELLSASQATRISAALETLPTGSREIVKTFLSQMVDSQDHKTLSQLKLI